MRVLSALHRWAGGLVGLLLAVMGLSGTVLLWEGSWVRVDGASATVVEEPARIAAIVDRAAAGGMSRITFASEEIGLHQLINADGSGAYVRHDGSIAETWASQWERPELWIFDLHHHLFSGETGETVTGVAGIAGLLFVLTGLLLWWRGRARFRPTLLPKRFKPGPIVAHHRNLGLLVSPVLLLSMTTGVLMLFTPIRDAVIGEETRSQRAIRQAPVAGAGDAIFRAKALFPDAYLRRIVLPRQPRGEIAVRLRQDFEWTPQGRTQVRFAPDGTVTIDDPAKQNRAASVTEKLYPIHSAKAGGVAMKLLMSVSGLSLAMLGGLATYAFWWRQALHRRPRRRPGAGPRAASIDAQPV